LQRTHPEAAERFMRQAQKQVKSRFFLYKQLADLAMAHAEEKSEDK
jgi:pyruvate-ferredoxin/flavodoxin oxidoreductase